MHTTLIQQRRQQMLTTEQQVIKILDWSYQQYCNYMYEMGTGYLKEYTNNDVAIIAKLETSKIFWNWFKNCWANRNQVFLEDVKRLHITNGFETAQKVNIAIYKGLQNSIALAEDLIIDNEIYKSLINNTHE